MAPQILDDCIGPGRVLVIARQCGDELVGCGGALLAHLSRQDPVSVIFLEAPLTPARMPDSPDEACVSADMLGYGRPTGLGLAPGEIRYSETLIATLGDQIDGFGPDLIYSCAPTEPLAANRWIGLSVAEALRRSGRSCRLAFFEMDALLQPNMLLDITRHKGRKAQALSRMAADGPEATLGRAARARAILASSGEEARDPSVEAFFLLEADALRRSRPGGPASLLLTAARASDAAESLRVPAPLVSVIVRSMARPELADALNSIALQTYPNIETIVVQASAGPPMSCPERVGHVPVRLLRGDGALPRSHAANLGLEHARGEYLAFLDDDDWWLPEHLAALVPLMSAGPERAVYSGVRCVREAEGDWVEAHGFNAAFEPDRLLVENFIPIHSVLFHRSLYEEGCRFDPALDVYEDWDFWVQVSRLTGMRHHAEITAIYRLASGAGFGVDAEGSEVAEALERFLAKWRGHWTPLEIMTIIERARAAQGIQVMQRQVRLLEAQRDQFSEHAQVWRTRAKEAERQRHQAQIEAKTLEGRLLVEHLSERERVSDELKRLLGERQRHYEQVIGEVSIARDVALATLDDVYGSTSWRVTRPLRGARSAVSAVRAGARAASMALPHSLRWAYRRLLPQRLRQQAAPAVARLTASLPQLIERSTDDGWQSAPFPAQPLQILKIPKEHLARCASTLVIPTSEDPEVSIVMPVFNHPKYTLECLASLVQHPPQTEFELILIDDASSQDTKRLLRAVRGIRLIENAENLGFLRSCNKAAATARGRYLMFLNNDTQVRAGWLDHLVAPFADAAVGMTGSKLLYPSGHLQEAGVSISADGVAHLIGLNGDPASPAHNRLREVDYCSGASFMIERTLFESLGGFDTRFAPAYFEDADLAFQVRSRGRKVLYQPASEVVHHLSVTTEASGDKLIRIEANRDKFVQKWATELETLNQVRLISFYLPQFHPIPENDAWWGEGFTEWTNVTRARPTFEGHYQPHLPTDLGFYDLRLAEIRQRQADLARRHGIYGFCYYYYWFNGHRLLHRPLDGVLASGEPDFPFCVCWANENWSRRWDGRDADLLMTQHYSPEDDVAFIRALFPALADPRYIRINGRPLVLLYRASLLPDSQATTDRWREECLRAGLPEPYLARVLSFEERHAQARGFDAAVEFPPHGHAVEASPPQNMSNPGFRGRFYDYPATARAFAAAQYETPKLFRGVMPSWDNTARRQDAADIFLDASPSLYEQWLKRMIEETRDLHFGDERILFVNAWNEWAEGNHLEPDSRFGSSYLEATRRALDAVIVQKGVR
ncbi:glycosyltransferase [Thiorhodococcus mannitoliphagus]|uniref:Glycosyltransferase n=1 Tax=Thiorhodococcus mannitoliphagus TaxID=329406 RepID=A0A6P1DM85_9GAMM|nr:glycoside hydrolase family 99-like domain-containing protein [Thiorhodococcus mannitoliphagus]NEX19367.1 glycosyltransferase [Thiorhodococcus mannitoliphagus]